MSKIITFIGRIFKRTKMGKSICYDRERTHRSIVFLDVDARLCIIILHQGCRELMTRTIPEKDRPANRLPAEVF